MHDIDRSSLLPNHTLGHAITRLPGASSSSPTARGARAAQRARSSASTACSRTFSTSSPPIFVPKPDAGDYQRFFDRHAVDPARAAMFEDIAQNLVVPHERGMTTVLIVPQTVDPFREEFEQEAVKTPHIDHITDDLADFLRECILTPDRKLG